VIPYRWYPIVIGAATGVAAAALLSIVAWVGLALTGVSEDLTGPVLLGVIIGLVAAGYTAGRLGDRPVYQGGMAGLAVATAVVVISIFGGSPAPPLQVTILFGLGLLLGLAGGAVAGRRTPSYAGDVSSPDDRGPRPEESPDSAGQDAG